MIDYKWFVATLLYNTGRIFNCLLLERKIEKLPYSYRPMVFSEDIISTFTITVCTKEKCKRLLGFSIRLSVYLYPFFVHLTYKH